MKSQARGASKNYNFPTVERGEGKERMTGIPKKFFRYKKKGQKPGKVAGGNLGWGQPQNRRHTKNGPHRSRPNKEGGGTGQKGTGLTPALAGTRPSSTVSQKNLTENQKADGKIVTLSGVQKGERARGARPRNS